MESAPDMAATKPKKVLTEAQRLAFLKGREKRMANIEKKRLEKEEAKQVEEPAPEPPPEIPTLKRAEPRATSTPPPPSIDENKIADTVAERVWAKMQAAKPKRKPYTRKEKTETSLTPPPPPPPTHSFTWM